MFEGKILNERIKQQKQAIQRLEAHVIKIIGEQTTGKAMINAEIQQIARKNISLQAQIESLEDINFVQNNLLKKIVGQFEKMGMYEEFKDINFEED